MRFCQKFHSLSCKLFFPEINGRIFEQKAKTHIVKIHRQLSEEKIVEIYTPKKVKSWKEIDIFGCESVENKLNYIYIEIEQFINRKASIGEIEFWKERGQMFMDLLVVLRNLT